MAEILLLPFKKTSDSQSPRRAALNDTLVRVSFSVGVLDLIVQARIRHSNLMLATGVRVLTLH